MEKKRILLVDNITYETDNLINILNEFFEYNVDIMIDYEKAISMYDKNIYEFIVVDHNINHADSIVEHVLTKNPLQKFILLSESLKCPVPCDMCLSNFCFVRLLKPIDIVEIIKYINKKVAFECPNKYVFSSLQTIEQLDSFIKLDTNSCYIKKERIENKLYIRPDDNKNINMLEVEKIQNLVNEEYFTLSILEDGIIEITEKE